METGYGGVMAGIWLGVDVGWKAGWRVVWWGMRGMIGVWVMVWFGTGIKKAPGTFCLRR